MEKSISKTNETVPIKSKKKLYIIVICVASMIVIIGTLITIFVFNSPSTKEESAAEQDLTITLNAILNRSDTDGYVLGMNPAASISLLNSNDTSNKINSLISFKIDSVSIDDAKGIATITIISPDLYEVLNGINSTEEVLNDSDKLLSEINQSLNSDEYPKFETTIEVQIEKLGDHWFLIPDSQLSNALSGNLTQAYSQLGDNIINELIEGDSNE